MVLADTDDGQDKDLEFVFLWKPMGKEGEDVQVDSRVTSQQVVQLQEVIQKHSKAFSDTPGNSDLVLHKIVTGAAPPVAAQPYRLPLKWKDKITEEIQCKS